MKIFDFKFLIFLGLALVVYFMYKEIEAQREKLYFCEEKIKEILNKTSLAPQLTDNTNQPQIQCPLKSVIKPLTITENICKNPIELVHEETSEMHSSDIEISNVDPSSIDSVEHNEDVIEENDNEDNVEDDDDETDNVEDDENKVMDVINEEDENAEDNETNSKETHIINDRLIESSISVSESSISVTSSIEEKQSNNHIVEIYSNDNEKLNGTTVSDKEIVLSDNQELDVVLNELNNDLNKDIEIDNIEKVKKYEIATLSKMKIHDLQNLSKTENLSLDKKINGHLKKKTKHELIEELSKI